MEMPKEKNNSMTGSLLVSMEKNNVKEIWFKLVQSNFIPTISIDYLFLLLLALNLSTGIMTGEKMAKNVPLNMVLIGKRSIVVQLRNKVATI